MAQEIELPDGRVLEFPDNMSQEQMSQAIQKNFPEFKRPVSDIGSPETPGTMPDIEPAYGSVKEAAKAGVRGAMPYARPVIEAATSVGAALAAAPTTPAGMAVAGGLGYGIGAEASDLIEQWAQPDRTIEDVIAGKEAEYIGRAQPKTVGGQVMQSAKDIAFGTTMEMGGQLAAKGISASAKFAMNKLRDIGKVIPPLTTKGATRRAGEILTAQTTDGPLVAQNLAEAEALEEAIPGLKFTRGQATGEAGQIKFERARARMAGEVAQEQLEQAASNSKAIREFIDKQKGLSTTADVIEPLAKKEAEIAEGVETARKGLEQESGKLTGMSATETGETIRTAARAGKKEAQEQAGKLFEEVPEFPIDAKQLISKIDELSAPLNKFEAVGKNVPEEFAQYKKVLEETGGISTPQDLQGLSSELKKSMRDAQGAANPNSKVISRISKLIGEVDNVLREAGESKIATETPTYRGGHEAPSPDYGAPGHDLAKDIYPDDIYSGKASQYYGHGDSVLDNKTVDIYNKIKGKPDADVKIYRAVPTEYKGTKIQEGDWVTINKDYAELHGESALGGDYEIIETTAKAKEIYTDGNSFHEWGYWPEEVAQVPKDAAEKLKTAQQFFKKEVIEKFKSGTTGDILKKGAKGDKVSNAQIASRYFKPGNKGIEQATEFVESVGDNPQARGAIEDYIKQDLLSFAKNPVTGEVIESKLKTWITRHKPALKKLGLENRFNTVVKASEELNKAKDMQVAFNKSVASKVLNADVDTAVKAAFASGSKRKAAERLMGQLKGDKKAVSGLQNATIDHIITNAETTAVDAFNNPIVSLAKVEGEFKKLKPAIDVLFKGSPEKLKALNQYRSALKLLQRGKASPLGGGSDTAENIITAMAKSSGLTHSRALNVVKALSKPLRDMSDGQVNAILNRAAFDPEFAQTIKLAASGRPARIIKTRLTEHIATLGLRETLKDKEQ